MKRPQKPGFQMSNRNSKWWSENRPTPTTWKIISSKLKMKCHKPELNMYNDYHNLERELVNSWFEVLQMHLGSTFSLLYSLGPKREQGRQCRETQLILTAFFFCWLVFQVKIILSGPCFVFTRAIFLRCRDFHGDSRWCLLSMIPYRK